MSMTFCAILVTFCIIYWLEIDIKKNGCRGTRNKQKKRTQQRRPVESRMREGDNSDSFQFGCGHKSYLGSV